jgi:hypothetical protein
MHGPIIVKSPNNISKWQMRFNTAFKGLNVNGTAERGNATTEFKKWPLHSETTAGHPNASHPALGDK